MNPRDGPERTLLLVDADPALRTVAQLHLGRAGYAILEAPDEAAAFELLRQAPVDVAVCPLHQARVDVARCLRRLRGDAEPRVRALPVLLLANGGVDEELAGLCTSHGPAVALETPHTGPRLAAAVERLLPRG